MFTFSVHAVKQAQAKGMDLAAVRDAAQDPTITYANGRYAGQMRHIKGSIVAVVDPAKQIVVTVYENMTETALRPDQTDRDAMAYGLRTAKRKGGK